MLNGKKNYTLLIACMLLTFSPSTAYPQTDTKKINLGQIKKQEGKRGRYYAEGEQKKKTRIEPVKNFFIIAFKKTFNKLMRINKSVAKTMLETAKTFNIKKGINAGKSAWEKHYFGAPKEEIKKTWTFEPEILQTSKQPRITWIGHATMLIQGNGINILTDPIFGDLSKLLKRDFPPGISLPKLPHIHLILISHNHRDHLELPAIKYILEKQKNNPPTIIVPAGTQKTLRPIIKKIKNPGAKKVKIIELYQWADALLSYDNEEISEKEQIKFVLKESSLQKTNKKVSPSTNDAQAIITFLSANHNSNRGFFDVNSAAWGSFMIELVAEKASPSMNESLKIYFSGDTAYSAHFEKIGKLFPDINVAIISVGPNNRPESLKTAKHVNAKEAWQGFRDLKADFFIPMHWGTFDLRLDKFFTPITILNKISQDEKNDQNLLHLGIGQSVTFKKTAAKKRSHPPLRYHLPRWQYQRSPKFTINPFDF